MVFKDFSFLNFLKWVRVTLVYLKIFLSGLRKTSLREDYFCCGLGVSTFQTGRWGFSYRAGNSFSLLPSPLPNLRQALQSQPFPGSSQVLWALFLRPPLICLQEKGNNPLVDLTLTRLPSPAFLTCWDMLLPVLQWQRRFTYHGNKQSFLFISVFLVEEQLLLLL